MSRDMRGEPRLPPGQTQTEKFPVVGEKNNSSLPALDMWRLVVRGLIDAPFELTYDELRALPQRELKADINCVTGWTHLSMRFVGVPLAELLASQKARALPEARFVRFMAYSDRNHDTSLPVALALDDTWLIHSLDGESLSPEHGYPLRTVTPSRYFYKSVKWIHHVEFLSEDRLGFWERESNYHNNAAPWPGNERYISGAHKPEEIERFRNARSYTSYRSPRKYLLGADLSGWSPGTQDIGAIHLKDCDLKGASLDGANLRGANFTRSRFQGASLRGADLNGADLEGASFIGADLTDANLSGTALGATRFVSGDEEVEEKGARVTGMRWDGATGLLEEQEKYLLQYAIPPGRAIGRS